MAEYYRDRRGVREQVLRLDSLQARRLRDLLEENYRPGNRTYLYNFLYDNCTTRARDIITAALEGDVAWEAPPLDKSFWNLLDECLAISPWTRWGIHAILGSPATAAASGHEQMFLPDYLLRGLEFARHDGQPLALPARFLHDAPDARPLTPWYLSPLFVFAAGVACLLLLLERRRGRGLLRGVALPYFIVTGVTGCLLVFLGYFTLHPTTAPNANLLWANPLNLLLAPLLLKKRLPAIARGYLRVYLALLVAGLLSWPFFTPAVLYSTMIIMLWMCYLAYRLQQNHRPGK
jgi:hypothetical protein